jgi:hypothetical protein
MPSVDELADLLAGGHDIERVADPTTVALALKQSRPRLDGLGVVPFSLETEDLGFVYLPEAVALPVHRANAEHEAGTHAYVIVAAESLTVSGEAK